MAGRTPAAGQAPPQGGDTGGSADLYSAEAPVTQADLFNMQQQGGKKAAPVFSGGSDMGGRISAIRQLLASNMQGGGQGPNQVRKSSQPPGGGMLG